MADLAQAQQTEHRNNDDEQTEYEEYVEELNEKPKG